MQTYYRNERGRIVVNSPYRNATFYEMTREANLTDFNVEPRQSALSEKRRREKAVA